MKYFYSLFFLLFALISSVDAQVRVSGRVYSKTRTQFIPGVTVMSNSGRATMTDSLGKYVIYLNEADSIWFSYQNKSTQKFSLNDFPNPQNFEISLHIPPDMLPAITVYPRNYKLDSIRNRQEYAKAFNYQKPGLATSVNPDGGVGVDLNELLNVFNFSRNKRMSQFRDRLLQEEEDAYIYSRFSRALVIRLTGLKDKDLDYFMRKYKPPVQFVRYATEYELQSYIKKCYLQFTFQLADPQKQY